MYSLHFQSGTGKVASAPTQQHVIVNVVQRQRRTRVKHTFSHQKTRMEPRVSSQSIFQRAADVAPVFMNKW